jgi:hypothetical protein
MVPPYPKISFPMLFAAILPEKEVPYIEVAPPNGCIAPPPASVPVYVDLLELKIELMTVTVPDDTQSPPP